MIKKITINCYKDHEVEELFDTLDKFKIKNYDDIKERFVLGSITVNEEGVVSASYIQDNEDDFHWTSHHMRILEWLSNNLEYKRKAKALI